MVRSRKWGGRPEAERFFRPVRAGLILLLLAVVAGACAPGAPPHPAKFINPNGISDDIWAATMARTDGSEPSDPNLVSVYPKSYNTLQIR